jgi:purine-nucleoside phosphorylase
MSTVPEAIVATHCGIKVFGLSLITNSCIMEYDCKDYASHEEVLETAKMRSQDIQTLITKMVSAVKV